MTPRTSPVSPFTLNNKENHGRFLGGQGSPNQNKVSAGRKGKKNLPGRVPQMFTISQHSLSVMEQ